jgi:hypothetical protein
MQLSSSISELSFVADLASRAEMFRCWMIWISVNEIRPQGTGLRSEAAVETWQKSLPMACNTNPNLGTIFVSNPPFKI